MFDNNWLRGSFDMHSQVRFGNKVFYPLTHAQLRIWYTEKLHSYTSLCNIGGTNRINGVVDFNLLEEAINNLVKFNDGLRLRIIEQNEAVYQYVSEHEPIRLDFKDFSIYENPDAELNKWVEEEASKPFVLENGRLFYFALFKISDNDCGYFAKFHHIISDGWSIKIVTEQICNNYVKLFRGEEIKHQEQYSYLEYIDKERKYLNSDRFIKNKEFWYEKLKELPENFLVNSSKRTEAKRSTIDLDKCLSSRIKSFVSENRCSINTFFVSILLFYINISTQKEDIIIGTPVLNRSDKVEKNIFGMFTSTMPFRVKLSCEGTILDIISDVHKGLKNCYVNQKYPYDLLASDLDLNRRGYENLFQFCVNYYNTKLASEFNGVPSKVVEFHNGNQLYSLQLVIREWSDTGCITLDLDYKTSDYTSVQITRIFKTLKTLIEQVLSNPYEKLCNLTYMSEEEKNELLYEFNSTSKEYPSDKTVFQLFEEQVEKTPDRIAVSFGDEMLTYLELNQRANQLARFLRQNGVEQETIVGIMVSHSLDMVIAILGIIKSGGAYLPIDPEYPSDRIDYILKDSGAAVLLTDGHDDKISDFNGRLISIHDKSMFTGEMHNLGFQSRPDHLVYVIYTSGSTGKPKGVMIEHRGLVNYIWWAKKLYVKSEEDAFALYSSLSFDLTVTSVFTPLIGGNKIVVYKDDGDEYILHKIMRESKVSIIKLTPSHLSLLKDSDNRNSSVKRFIVGGEDLKTSLAASIHESFLGDIEIFNEYGPTETVVGCMIHKYEYEKDNSSSVPIGVPADNVQIYILNSALKPVPKGNCGELYISGDGVARGYLNRVELTKERFIDNPFLEDSKLYKTGDLARFLDKGIIEYAGRIDHQVKIRGHRIELGEIEKYLLSIEGVKDAVVIDRKDEEENKYLCAYVVSNEEVRDYKIRSCLSELLPYYMIPAYIVCLDSIPLTPNGKVDRGLLPEPKSLVKEKTELVAPKNEMEQKLIDVIKEVLGVERIGMSDNFYWLGGDSIKAIQVAAKLNKMGLKIKTKDILSNAVFEEMAIHLERTLFNDEADQNPCEGYVEHTPITSWFFSQPFENFNYYNQSVLLTLKKDIHMEKLQRALKELICHHDALRLNYDTKSNKMFFNPDHLSIGCEVNVFDLLHYPYDKQDSEMVCIGEELKSSMDIENGLLIKSCVFDLGTRGKRLLLTAHHLVIDGVSWRIVLEDLANLLSHNNNNKEAILPMKTLSIQKWALALARYAQNYALEDVKYWEGLLGKHYTMDTDFDTGSDTVEHSNSICAKVNKREVNMLLSTANSAYGTQTVEILMISLILTIREFLNRDNIILEIEGHGREEIFDNINVYRTVGWFTCIYPAVFNICGDGISSQIKALKEQIREVQAKGFHFGMLKNHLNNLENQSVKHIRFNFLGDFDGINMNGLFEVSDANTGSDCAKNNEMTCLIDINALIKHGELEIRFTYSRNKFRDETMNNLLDLYKNKLLDMIEHCCNKVTREFTPSDFETVDISQEELDGLFS